MLHLSSTSYTPDKKVTPPRVAITCLFEPEFLHKCLVSLLIDLLEVLEEVLALRHHLEESAPRMKVFAVLLEVSGEALDLGGKESHLVLR